MTRFSDAALLKGKFAFHADQLRESTKASSAKVDWSNIEPENTAEEAAQEVAKHIFAFNEAIDSKKEQLEIMTLTAAGQMKVLGLAPGEGDILRVDGVLMPDQIPTSIVIHSSQLALTFVRVPIETPQEEAESESNRIGFVIFDDLQDRQKARYKKKKTAAKKAKNKIPTMEDIVAATLKANKKAKAAKKKKTAKKTATQKTNKATAK